MMSADDIFCRQRIKQPVCVGWDRLKRSSLVSSTGTRLFFLERCQRQIADQMHRFFFIVSSLFCLGRIKESFPPTPPPRTRITPVSIYQVILFDDKSHLFKERKKEIIARASKKNHGHTREGRLDYGASGFRRARKPGKLYEFRIRFFDLFGGCYACDTSRMGLFYRRPQGDRVVKSLAFLSFTSASCTRDSCSVLTLKLRTCTRREGSFVRPYVLDHPPPRC